MFLFLSHLQCQNFTDQQKNAGWTDNEVTAALGKKCRLRSVTASARREQSLCAYQSRISGIESEGQVWF